MRHTRSTLIAAATFAVLAGSSWADDTPKDTNKRTIANASRSDTSGFAKLDTNKSGYLSRKEAAADPALARDFDKFDLNHDGKLNRTEYLAARGKEDVGSMADKIKDPGAGTK